MNGNYRSDGRGLLAYWAFDEGEGKETLDQVSGTADPISYLFNDAVFTVSCDPQRRCGVKGGALLFDGFSTWITRSSEFIAAPQDALTITAWVAPRAYEQGDEERLSAIVNQHNREAKEGYILGMYRHGSWSLQLGIGGQWEEVWAEEASLKKGEWSFVSATYDITTGLMKLYLNGSEVASKETLMKSPITPSKADLLIGKNNQSAVLANYFQLNMFNGLIDELKIYDRALSSEEIKRVYTEDVRPYGSKPPTLAFEALKLDRSVLLHDKHRPQYHASPPAHWMNEPHAPIYFNGQYHLFYQHNPQGPYFHHLHWGHWVSEDLVHWRDLPIALAPERTINPDGAWSGSAVYDENGIPALFFTAGNAAAEPDQSVGLARSTFLQDGDPDLVHWVIHPEPVIVQEKGLGLTRDFRDPFVWKEGDQWNLIIGSGFEGIGGAALAYTSSDMVNWSYKGVFYRADRRKFPYLGPIWELPVLLPLGRNHSGEEKHLFLVSPVGPGSDVEVFYWIGTLDKERLSFTPDEEEPQLIDVGDFHFTGPSGMVDPRTGRLILFTIAQGDRTSRLEYQSGWAHNAGLPVSVYLREDGRLGLEPIEELTSLRGENLADLQNLTIAEINKSLVDITGDMLEIQIEFESPVEGQAGLKVRRSPDGEEETLLYYDGSACTLQVDRTRTTLSELERCKGIQGSRLELRGEPLRMHVYVDRSLIEAYVSGLKSLTTRAYPSRDDALGIQVVGAEGLKVITMKIWELRSIWC